MIGCKARVAAGFLACLRHVMVARLLHFSLTVIASEAKQSPSAEFTVFCRCQLCQKPTLQQP